MYNNLINSLKKILDDKSTQAEKLLKIKTLVDFAEGLEQPRWTPQPQMPVQPTQTWYDATKDPITGGPKITAGQKSSSPKPAGAGAIVGVEDVK